MNPGHLLAVVAVWQDLLQVYRARTPGVNDKRSRWHTSCNDEILAMHSRVQSAQVLCLPDRTVKLDKVASYRSAVLI